MLKLAGKHLDQIYFPNTFTPSPGPDLIELLILIEADVDGEYVDRAMTSGLVDIHFHLKHRIHQLR